jgi:hypothetical protein
MALVVTGLGLAMAGAAATIGGFVSAAAANQDGRDIDNALRAEGWVDACRNPAYRPRCLELQSTVEKANVLTGVGIGGLVGVTAGAALLVHELARPRRPVGKASPRVTMIVEPGAGALMIMGSF